MVYLDGFFGLALLGLWVFCIIDVIATDASSCRNLPKVGWLILVIVLFWVGAAAWLIAGRPWSGRSGVDRRIVPAPGFPEYERLGRAASDNPDADAEFLARCRARADEQRRRYAEQHRPDQDPPD